MTLDIAKLEQQLAEFEQRYHLDSAEFYERFERGEMGDSADFIEWAATYEMVKCASGETGQQLG